jgi:hypothetical protein
VEDASSHLVTSDALDSYLEDQESHPLADPNLAPKTTSLDFQTSFLVESIKLLNSSIRSKPLIIPRSEEITGIAYRVGCMVTFAEMFISSTSNSTLKILAKRSVRKLVTLRQNLVDAERKCPALINVANESEEWEDEGEARKWTQSLLSILCEIAQEMKALVSTIAIDEDQNLSLVGNEQTNEPQVSGVGRSVYGPTSSASEQLSGLVQELDGMLQHASSPTSSVEARHSSPSPDAQRQVARMEQDGSQGLKARLREFDRPEAQLAAEAAGVIEERGDGLKSEQWSLTVDQPSQSSHRTSIDGTALLQGPSPPDAMENVRGVKSRPLNVSLKRQRSFGGGTPVPLPERPRSRSNDSRPISGSFSHSSDGEDADAARIMRRASREAFLSIAEGESSGSKVPQIDAVAGDSHQLADALEDAEGDLSSFDSGYGETYPEIMARRQRSH